MCLFCTQRGVSVMQTPPSDSCPAGVAHKANPFGGLHHPMDGGSCPLGQIKSMCCRHSITHLSLTHHSALLLCIISFFTVVFLYIVLFFTCIWHKICHIQRNETQDDYLYIMWYISIRCNTDYTLTESFTAIHDFWESCEFNYSQMSKLQRENNR